MMRVEKVWAGVDIGKAGGIVFISETKQLLYKIPMPIIKETREYDLLGIINLFNHFKSGLTYVYIEQAMKFGGGNVSIASGTISLNECMGMFKGLLTAIHIPFKLIHPRTWQNKIIKPYQVNNKSTKQAGIEFCNYMWPGIDWRESTRCKKSHDGMTDAACLAIYGLLITLESEAALIETNKQKTLI